MERMNVYRQHVPSGQPFRLLRPRPLEYAKNEKLLQMVASLRRLLEVDGPFYTSEEAADRRLLLEDHEF